MPTPTRIGSWMVGSGRLVVRLLAGNGKAKWGWGSIMRRVRMEEKRVMRWGGLGGGSLGLEGGRHGNCGHPLPRLGSLTWDDSEVHQQYHWCSSEQAHRA